MKAEASRQLRLLELQALDTRLDQIAHAKATLAVQRQLDQLTARVDTHQGDLVRARTALEDVQREVAKADSDVQLVRDRAARNQSRLDSGAGTAKDMQALQHELQSLARRQSELEDIELEVMERAESLASEVTALEAEAGTLQGEVAELTAVRDSAVGALDREADDLVTARAAVVPDVGEDLLALYEKIRSASGGTGAAALLQRRCEGCRLELNQVDINRIRSAEADEVLRCEECRRILVRTPESGL